MTEAQLVGSDRLAASLPTALRELEDLTPAHQAAGQIIGARAHQLTPRFSGHLGAGNQIIVTAAGMEFHNPVVYAGSEYFGWPAHSIPAHPWAAQAADQTEPAWEAAYAHHVEQAVDKIQGA